MDFKYKKSLGQNFIYDLNFLRSMVSSIDINENDTVIEIGTGAGTLTEVLAESRAKIITVEIDARLLPFLEKKFSDKKNINLLFGDAMQKDFSIFGNFKVIANVPYYITTPLIMKFIHEKNCSEINVLVAREVADRIVAQISTHQYGALSVACQLVAECEIVKNVDRNIFTPKPNVDSAFVRLVKNGKQINSEFDKLIKGVFASRRKTVQNALSNVMGLDKNVVLNILKYCKVDERLRPEQIEPTKYWEISQLLTNYCN